MSGGSESLASALAGHRAPRPAPKRETLEGCTCGGCFDCPDGWHYGIDLPCSCTPGCALATEP